MRGYAHRGGIGVTFAQIHCSGGTTVVAVALAAEVVKQLIFDHAVHAHIGAPHLEAQGVARALKHFGVEFEIGKGGDAFAHSVDHAQLHLLGFGGNAAQHEVHRVAVEQLRRDFFLHQRVVAAAIEGGEHQLVAIAPRCGAAQSAAQADAEPFARRGCGVFLDVAGIASGQQHNGTTPQKGKNFVHVRRRKWGLRRSIAAASGRCGWQCRGRRCRGRAASCASSGPCTDTWPRASAPCRGRNS